MSLRSLFHEPEDERRPVAYIVFVPLLNRGCDDLDKESTRKELVGEEAMGLGFNGTRRAAIG
jgi:hypothetical protein